MNNLTACRDCTHCSNRMWNISGPSPQCSGVPKIVPFNAMTGMTAEPYPPLCQDVNHDGKCQTFSLCRDDECVGCSHLNFDTDNVVNLSHACNGSGLPCHPIDHLRYAATGCLYKSLHGLIPPTPIDEIRLDLIEPVERKPYPEEGKGE